jgi:aspartyl-tRNA(Asn)/glutamyl-tRNA(Gln) amidotransferase subunit A
LVARTVVDATLLMNVMVQPDPRDPTALPSNPVDYGAASKGGCSGLRIAVMENIGFGPATNAEVLTLFRAAVERFRAMGNSVEEIAAPFTQEDLQKGERFYQVRALAEMDLLPPDVQALGKVIKDWVEPARAYTGSDHYRDYLGTQELRVTMLDAMRGYDLLLLPTVPVPPYAAENPGLDDGDTFAPWCNTFVFNLTQQPAVTVPSGRTAGGLPVGLQIVGRRDDDIRVLKAALAHEAAAGLPNGIASP